MRRAGRGPGIERLIKRHRAACHGIAVHVQHPQRDLARSAADRQTLRGSGDGYQGGELRACPEGGIGDALAGAVQAGIGGDRLPFGQRSHGERLGGDAVGVGGHGAALKGDAARTRLPGNSLAAGGQALVQHQGLRRPVGRGSGSQRKLGSERGQHWRRSAAKLRLEAGAVGQRSGDNRPGSVRRRDIHGCAPIASGRHCAGGFAATQRRCSAGHGVDNRDAASRTQILTQCDDRESLRHADGHRAHGRGDQRERIARAGIVTDAAGDDGPREVDGQVVDLDIHRAGDARGSRRRDSRDFVGRDARNQRRLAAHLNRVGEAKAHAVNHDGPTGGRQPLWLNRVSIEEHALVGVVRPAVAALVCDANAHHIVGRGGNLQPALSRSQTIQPCGGSHSRSAHGIEGVPDTQGRHGLQVGGSAGLIQRNGEQGERAPTPDWKDEPVGLAHLAQPAAPHSARGQNARRRLASDRVVIAPLRRVLHIHSERLSAPSRHARHGDGRQRSRWLRRAIQIGPDRGGEDVIGIHRLEGNLVVGLGHARRQRHSAQVEEALQ